MSCDWPTFEGTVKKKKEMITWFRYIELKFDTGQSERDMSDVPSLRIKPLIMSSEA